MNISVREDRVLKTSKFSCRKIQSPLQIFMKKESKLKEGYRPKKQHYFLLLDIFFFFLWIKAFTPEDRVLMTSNFSCRKIQSRLQIFMKKGSKVKEGYRLKKIGQFFNARHFFFSMDQGHYSTSNLGKKSYRLQDHPPIVPFIC